MWKFFRLSVRTGSGSTALGVLSGALGFGSTRCTTPNFRFHGSNVDAEESLSKERIVLLLTEIARQEWPHHWPELHTRLFALESEKWSFP
jgi:hypothetical protein